MLYTFAVVSVMLSLTVTICTVLCRWFQTDQGLLMWFQRYTPLSSPRKVWLGDNSYITAHGIGHIPVHMRAKNKWNRVILQDVLYVPELHGNLLSVSALAKRGPRVQFFDHRREILDKDGTLTCVGHLDNSLYVVDARTSVSDS